MTVTGFPNRKLKDYKDFGTEILEEISKVAGKLKGLRVVHVNATAFGGGVAELLYTLIPLMQSVGIDARWEVLEAPPNFFNITKKMHNALQGADVEISDDEWDTYMKINEENAKKLNLDADVLIIHDPQPAALPMFLKSFPKLIWRCHIDLSKPNKRVWNRMREILSPYRKMLFHLKDYFPESFKDRSEAFPPSVDPLSDKNREITEDEINGILKKLGISRKPAITVVARFDPWKDLFSAVDVYRIVKKSEDVQLLIVSSMASDDPEGWVFYEKVLRYAGTDEDIKFLTNLIGVGSLEVNAIQRFSTLGLHTATREGFGLVISEMMWKGNPIVARPAGGVKIQVDDGENGYLRWSKEDLAQAILELLADGEKRRKFGRKAKEKVRRQFLTTSHLLRYLKIFEKI